MRKTSKILVTGASGFLGRLIIQELFARQVVAPESIWGWINHNKSIGGAVPVEGELSDAVDSRKILDRISPDIVMHVAAMSHPAQCEAHPELSEQVNVETTRNLVNWCSDTGAKLIFTSSDLVFKGDAAPYAESDPVNPISIYGEHKVRAEEICLSAGSQHVVCRMPLLVGFSPSDSLNFYTQMVNQLKKGSDLPLFYDEFRTPITGVSAANGLIDATALDGGVYHMGGPERISRYALGLLACRVHGLSSKSINKSSLKGFVPPRAVDVSLTDTKRISTGIVFEKLETQLNREES